MLSADAPTSSGAEPEQSPIDADTAIAMGAAVGSQEVVQGDSVSNDLPHLSKFVGQGQ